MENNDLNIKNNLENMATTEQQVATSLDGPMQNLTNEEKLENLSRLIQEAELNLNSDDKVKKLVK